MRAGTGRQAITQQLAPQRTLARETLGGDEHGFDAEGCHRHRGRNRDRKGRCRCSRRRRVFGRRRGSPERTSGEDGGGGVQARRANAQYAHGRPRPTVREGPVRQDESGVRAVGPPFQQRGLRSSSRPARRRVLRTVDLGGPRQPHRSLSLHTRGDQAHEESAASWWTDSQQRFHICPCAKAELRSVHRDEARDHGLDQVDVAGWPQVRHRLRPDRHWKRRHRNDAAHGGGRPAGERGERGRAATRSRARGARGRVHGEPPTRRQCSIHDRDGNEDAVHWSGMSTSKELPTHPLTGIRVVEVGIYMAGPFCAMQLADLGADVIKVENPDGGDIARDSAPFLDGESSPFIRLNRNKRSLAMNLKAPEGKEVFRELVQRADVVVENLRPGTMGDLELDYGRLASLNPGLVYIAASGWGQTGPYSQLAGLDIMAQAMSGLISITGEPNGDPVKVGVPICDLVCALYGTIGALAALRVRELTGRGQFIDVSLFEAGVSLAVWEAGRFFATGEIPGPLGSAHQTAAPYQAIRAADGFFTVGATTPRNWRSFCDVLDHPEWATEERFKDNPSRHARRDVLIPMIEQVTSREPRAHWVALLQKAGVPCAEIQTYDQVFNDPQLQARDFFWKGLHSKLGEVEQIGSPIHFSDTPARRGPAGPVLGEHTSEVLRALGRTDAEIVDLKAKGVLGGI